MLRIPKRDAVRGASSVLSFASLIAGSNALAACSNAGAIMRHGPHHGAQKSTTIGRSDRAMWASKLSSSSETGLPVNSGSLQRPQRACSPRRSSSTRFTVTQWGHTTCTEGLSIAFKHETYVP
jgi:hypothetical protein